MSKKLPFLTFAYRPTDDWLKNTIFELNNELTVPVKILEIEKCKKDNGKFGVWVIVEDILDTDEWDKVVSLFLLGFNGRAKITYEH